MYITVFLIGMFTGAGWWSGHKIMDAITTPQSQQKSEKNNP